ncbi:hypothetical protein N1851_015287 [Merluccius polli]|uniref:Alkylated DNA repair protein AlkB homologue 8 N-terminal domain-containing protein n=1 Tax=Merluccius polli TaxID=89951 RepID=A0AA47P2B7_MERPO|nr:hypothetical protein N1851_015287 [Merluccius polli]
MQSLVELPELSMGSIFLYGSGIEGLHQVHTQAGKHHKDHFEVGKLHHFSDEASQAVVYVRVLAQELCQMAKVGLWEYSGATNLRHMSSACPATLAFLLSTSRSTMKLCSTCSIFISASTNRITLFMALLKPSVVWVPQKICPAGVSKLYISANSFENPLLCSVLSAGGIRRADGTTAMAVAPPRVCVDGWFILGAMIAHAPQVCSPTQPESISLTQASRAGREVLCTDGTVVGISFASLLVFNPSDTILASPSPDGPQPIYINGTAVERVDTFKYLGVNITKDLTWDCHATAVIKKAQQRLYGLRRLKKFGLRPNTIRDFYRGTIESLLTGSFTAWYGSCTDKDRKALRRVVRTAKNITGCELPSLEDLYTQRCLNIARRIIEDPTHPHKRLFSPLKSRRVKGYKILSARTSRLRNSFFPQAIRLLNDSAT